MRIKLVVSHFEYGWFDNAIINFVHHNPARPNTSMVTYISRNLLSLMANGTYGQWTEFASDFLLLLLRMLLIISSKGC